MRIIAAGSVVVLVVGHWNQSRSSLSLTTSPTIVVTGDCNPARVDRNGEVGEAGDHFLLARRAAIVDRCRRGAGRQTGTYQLAADRLEITQSHVDDQGTVGIGDLAPVDAKVLRYSVACPVMKRTP